MAGVEQPRREYEPATFLGRRSRSVIETGTAARTRYFFRLDSRSARRAWSRHLSMRSHGLGTERALCAAASGTQAATAPPS